MIYTYNDDETEVRPIPTLHGTKIMVRIRTENMINVVFRQNEEPQCIAQRNLLNAANVQLVVHPWARSLHPKFDMHACAPLNKPMYFLLSCTVSSDLLGPILYVLMPVAASSTAAAAEHLSTLLTREVFVAHGNVQKLRLLSGLQLEYDLRTAIPKVPISTANDPMMLPLDGSMPVSPTNPCIGNLLLSFFHNKAMRRYRARIEQFSIINPILKPCDDGTITPQQLEYLKALRCTDFSNVFLPKPGVTRVPDLNLLSMETQRVAMPPYSIPTPTVGKRPFTSHEIPIIDKRPRIEDIPEPETPLAYEYDNTCNGIGEDQEEIFNDDDSDWDLGDFNSE